MHMNNRPHRFQSENAESEREDCIWQNVPFCQEDVILINLQSLNSFTLKYSKTWQKFKMKKINILCGGKRKYKVAEDNNYKINSFVP